MPSGPWQSEMPVAGHQLVGWRVMSHFPRADRNPWYEGVVVAYDGKDTHIVFSDHGHFHEEWQLPDNELAYHKVTSKAGMAHMRQITPSMMPSDSLDGDD